MDGQEGEEERRSDLCLCFFFLQGSAPPTKISAISPAFIVPNFLFFLFYVFIIFLKKISAYYICINTVSLTRYSSLDIADDR